MLLTIHDANLQKVAFIDNDKQSTLNYYDDIWTRNLETGSSTFEFTVFKKAIKSDTVTSKTYNLLNERAFVSFRYHGKSYVFSVMTTEEDEQTIKCYCENLNLELINEYANPYKADKAMSFVEYCNAMDLLSFTHLSVGINEISDQKRTLEWEGQDTKLARLLSLATKFDAEIDFDTELNADSSIKSFKVNVYHEYDDKHQGVGRVRNDIQLTYGKNLRSIKRKIDKTGIYTLIRPTGKGKTKDKDGNEVDTVVTIAGLPAWSEKNADGVLEFYQSGEALYAPLAAQMYPSTFTSSTQGDQWIRKDMEVDSDNPSVIRSSAIANLRKNAYPALTYEVDGFLDVEIGDTVKIYDDGFTPILLIKARVSDQKISFTNPRNNKTTFANFKALENNLSSGIQSAFERLFEASKPYTIKLATDNGVIFKNQIGQSLITPTLFKGGKPVVADVTWRWALDGVVTVGMQYLAKASTIKNTAVLTVSAYVGNNEVATTEITLTNVNDGADGAKGDKGETGNGVANTVITYGLSTSETTEPATWASNMPVLVKGMYLWTRTVQIYTNGTSSTSYQKGYIAKDGAQGLPGTPGKDAQTQYTHIAYADNATGGGFSLTDNTKPYWGMYQDFNAANSNDPTKYKWSKWKGDQGLPGAPGADGKTPYIHFAYADDNKGTNLSFTDKNQQYMGYYSDYTEANSTDYTKYKWVDRLANVQVGGQNLLTGTRDWSSNIRRWANNGVWNNEAEDYNNLKVKSTTQGWNGWHQNVFVKAGEYYTLSYYAKADTNIKVKNSLTWEQSPIFQGPVASFVGSNDISDNITTEWKRYSRTVKITGDGSLQWRIEYDGNALPNGKWYIAGMKLERGNIATDYSQAPEDVQEQIDSKADSALTQEQLNALTEKNNLIKAEMEAKASIDTVNQWITAYQNYVNANDEAKAESERNLQEASARILQLKTDVGTLRQQWDFIDTYMTVQNEGLIIGKSDGSAYAKFANDRISLFSGSSEVMYISQGVLRIENGIFTKTIQIGRFRFETHPADADMLVVRFLGG